MATLQRIILVDGVSILAFCENGPRLSSSADSCVESAGEQVTLVSDDRVLTIDANRLEAILPVESTFQIPTHSTVYRFALVG